MGMESVFRLSVVMGMVDKLTPQLPGVEKNLSGTLQKVNNGFGSMQRAGVAMAGLGTGILSATAGIVTSTFDTQNALGELASLGVKDLKAVEKAAKSFSDTWAGTTKADFISASYDIKSGIASLSDEGVAKYTELAGLTAKATKSTVGEMTSLFATGYGIYKGYYGELSDIEFGEMFSSGIAVAVKNYKTSGSEMAASISSLGASATNAKIPMEEQLAILGQLQATMSGSEAGTKYKAFLEAAAGAGEKLGLTFIDANNQLLSMPDILEALRGKYGETIDAVEKQELGEAFGTDEAIELIDLLYNNVGTLDAGIQDLQASMSGGVEATQKMAETINNTPAQKFEILKQQIQNSAEALASGLLPGVNNLLDGINGVIGKISEWVANNQDTVTSIMQVGIAIGALLIVAGIMSAVFGTVGKVLLSASTIINTVKRAVTLLNIAFSANPIAIVTAAVILLITALTSLYNSSEAFRSFWDNLGTLLPQVIQMGVQVILGLINSIISALPSLISIGASMIVSLIQGISAAIPGIITSGVQILVTLIQGIVSNLPTIIQSGISIILALIDGLISAVPSLISAIPEVFGALIDGIMSVNWLEVGIDIITAIIEGLVGAIGKLGSALINGIKSLFGKGEPEQAGAEAVEKMSAGIEGSAGKAQEAAGNTVQKALSGFGSADTSGVSEMGSSLGNLFGNGLQSGQNLAAEAAGGITSTAVEGLKTVDSATVESLGVGIGTTFGTGINQGSAASKEAANAATAAWTEAGSQMEGIWGRLPDKFRAAFEIIRSTASSYTLTTVAIIRSGFENMQITIPRPRIPHINVAYSTVGSGGAEAKVPNFSVSYYAKGGIMTRATAFGVEPGTGNTMIGGEAGPEAILPLDEFWMNLKDVITGLFVQGNNKEQENIRALKSEKKGRGFTRPEQTKKVIRIGKLEIHVDVEKIKDLDALTKLIEELKDVTSDEPVTE